jgi:uncharacterized membrane protein YcaP (DUF421 family)
MDTTIRLILGAEHDVSVIQMCARAALIFVYGLIMLRISGRRTFAQLSVLDLVVSFIVGSALSRAMTGSVPLAAVLAAVAVLVGLHVVVSYAIAVSTGFSRLVEGTPVCIVKDGVIDDTARRSQMISLVDLDETLRGKGLAGLVEIAKAKSMTLEPSGKISVVRAS